MGRKAVIGLFLFQALNWVVFAIEAPSRRGEIRFLGPDSLAFGGALVLVIWAIWLALMAKTRGELLYIAFIAVSLTLASFADIYLLSGWQHWSVHLHHRTALAIAIGTLTTVGPPGVSPTTDFARGLLAWQQVVDLVLVFVLFAVVARRLPARQHDAGLEVTHSSDAV